MSAREKFTSLKFNNIVIFIYDDDWISGVEYEVKDNQETKNKDYNE